MTECPKCGSEDIYRGRCMNCPIEEPWPPPALGPTVSVPRAVWDEMKAALGLFTTHEWRWHSDYAQASAALDKAKEIA